MQGDANKYAWKQLYLAALFRVLYRCRVYYFRFILLLLKNYFTLLSIFFRLNLI